MDLWQTYSSLSILPVSQHFEIVSLLLDIVCERLYKQHKNAQK